MNILTISEGIKRVESATDELQREPEDYEALLALTDAYFSLYVATRTEIVEAGIIDEEDQDNTLRAYKRALDSFQVQSSPAEMMRSEICREVDWLLEKYPRLNDKQKNGDK